MTELKGMIVSILRDASLTGDCTNGGVTSPARGATDVYLVGPGIAPVFTVDDRRPVLKLVKRILWGTPYFHAEPLEPPPAGSVGWMAGGNFVYSSDSRFNDATAGYPISVHDRSETVREYESLSR